MEYQSRNMSYAFYSEYYQDLPERFEQIGTTVHAQERTSALCSFSFPESDILQNLREIDGFRSFSLITAFPGLAVGLGYTHDLMVENAVKIGFSFDYTSGLPYIPGSELKGTLRSVFPGASGNAGSENKELYLRGCLGESALDPALLEEALFDYGIVFLGAYPKKYGKKPLMNLDYLTPHKRITDNPIPIPFLKVRPEVEFEFCFAMPKEIPVGDRTIGADAVQRLFKQLILDLGIGAKSSVGFGRFAEMPAPAPQAQAKTLPKSDYKPREKTFREAPPKEKAPIKAAQSAPEEKVIIKGMVTGRAMHPSFAITDQRGQNKREISFYDGGAFPVGTEVTLEFIGLDEKNREKWVCIDPKLPKRW